jgi:hypothetical protein
MGSSIAKLVGKKNNIRIYNRSLGEFVWVPDSANESNSVDWIEFVLRFKDKLLVNFASNGGSYIWVDYSTFINNRYGQYFARKDLKVKGEKWMIDFILDKEDERLNNKQK